jgi:signal transduction histidine kinase
VAQSLRLALVVLGAVALALGAIEIAVFAEDPGGPVWALVAVGWVYVAAGLVAWSRRPSNRIGALLVGGGFAWLAASLGNTSAPVLAACGAVLATAPLAVVVHLLHAFPSGRLSTAASRTIVGVGWFVALVLQAPLYLFTTRYAPNDLLTLVERPDLAAAGTTVQQWAGAVVMVTTTVALAGRLRRADAVRQRVLAPLFSYGILAVLFIPISSTLLTPWLGLAPATRAVLQLIVLAGVPVAFALGMLRGGFARTGELEELGAWLGTTGAHRADLAAALARTLGDGSLRLVFWGGDRYLDAQGAPAPLPAAGSGQATVEIELAGRRVGAIVYDAMLIADEDLVRTAGRVVALAVDHERLTAQLRASEDELRLSRSRIVEAGDRERRRIARNLHDGLQVRLVLLAMDAQQVAKDPAAPAATQLAATTLRTGIDDAAAELRALVHAVMPAPLIERGLSAATEDLVDRVTMPTRLQLDVVDGVLPAAVESTAYFVVAEGLANALKYAGARELAVRLSHADGWLVVEVHDDGVGGAVVGGGPGGGGSGLRGLADRVDTLGGRMRVVSPPGRGTRLVAELPCGS